MNFYDEFEMGDDFIDQELLSRSVDEIDPNMMMMDEDDLQFDTEQPVQVQFKQPNTYQNQFFNLDTPTTPRDNFQQPFQPFQPFQQQQQQQQQQTKPKEEEKAYQQQEDMKNAKLYVLNTRKRKTLSKADYPHLRKPMDKNAITLLRRVFPNMQPTPIIRLNAFEETLHVKRIFVKDESRRSDLKSFHVLGTTYTMLSTQATAKNYTCASNDGNFGRAVAWTSNVIMKRQDPAIVYLPADTPQKRIEGVYQAGGRPAVCNGLSYPETIEQCRQENAGMMISESYQQALPMLPGRLMCGYKVIVQELQHQLKVAGCEPTHIFVQAGSALPAAIAYYYHLISTQKPPPKLILVESFFNPFFFNLLAPNANVTSTPPNHPLLGFHHGSPKIKNTRLQGLYHHSPLLNDEIQLIMDTFDMFLRVFDNSVRRCMKLLFQNQPLIYSGETGAAASLTALIWSASYVDVRETLQLNRNSNVVIINTEGDVDTDFFASVVSHSKL